MTQLQRDIKRYLKEVDKLLFGSHKNRKKFLIEYEKSIYENMEETRREYDYEQLVLYFGSPATVATNYACAFEPELNVAKRQNKKKKYIVTVFCAIVVIICLMIIASVMMDSAFYYHYSYQMDAGGILH